MNIKRANKDAVVVSICMECKRHIGFELGMLITLDDIFNS
jgi:hypothetical protein